MALRGGALGEIKAPLAWLAGGAVVVSALVALFLFSSDKRDTGAGQALAAARRAADNVAAPIGGAMSKPVGWAGEVSAAVHDYLFAASQNRDLRRALVADQAWRDEVGALRVENARLRALLGLSLIHI